MLHLIKGGIILLILAVSLAAQNYLKGTVYEYRDNGNKPPLTGANVFWLSTSTGTTTDIKGEFSIPLSDFSNKLVISFIGFTSDTLSVSDQTFIESFLIPDSYKTNDVEVVAKLKSTFTDFKGIENTSIVTKRELQKAACCNLSESFETNASIDVSFTDAITGTKQIEMLGLSGIYTQTTMENLPFLRGLISTAGLTFIPGTWIQSINVSKGIGSVANGYESITGQIDIDMKQPFNFEEKPLFVNIYGDNDQRFEGNLNYRYQFSDHLSSITLLNLSRRKHQYDMNNDQFMDMPTFSTYNIMQRWKYSSGEGLESQFGFQYVKEDKEGGTISNPAISNFTNYKYGMRNENIGFYGKTGYVFPDSDFDSFGLQWSLNSYKNSSVFGNRLYDGSQKSAYVNLIYQSAFGSSSHKYRTGASFLFDQYDEYFNNTNYNRIERVPGVFFEYTYTSPAEDFSAVVGLRGDMHSEYGFMFTPRLHLRYSPDENWVLRGAVGKGYRTSNILVEYAPVFASSRTLDIQSNRTYGYGLNQEAAWNYGVNLTHYFLYDYREATITLDFYRTKFEEVVISDLDTDPKKASFYSAENGEYSNSFQVEFNIELVEGFDTRLAYRYLDVKQNINNDWKEKPLTAKHRALINLGYTTGKDEEGTQMLYDITFQWFGQKRIPSTLSNPAEFRSREHSPDFIMVNAQVTRTFYKGFDFYLGVENLLGFKQNNPIINPMNPDDDYFDASLIWGPVNGRMVYAGIRYEL